MTEISYITQNGQQINLKDAAGRELLATKQNKLKAGNGISIAADGTISAVGGGGKVQAFVAIDTDGDKGTSDYSFVNLSNPGFFQKGKTYKATLIMPSIYSDVDYLIVCGEIQQGSTGFVYKKTESNPDGYETIEEFLSKGGESHEGISGWSPEPIYFGTQTETVIKTKKTDEDYINEDAHRHSYYNENTQQDDYDYEKIINVNDYPTLKGNHKTTEIPLGEFTYTFNPRNTPIHGDWETETYGTYLADDPVIRVDLCGYAGAEINNDGVIVYGKQRKPSQSYDNCLFQDFYEMPHAFVIFEEV